MTDDKTLVEKTLKGEKEAFEMIIRKYQQPLLNYIGRMISDYQLALDLTQEVFVKTYHSLHMYQPKYKFSTWLYKISHNHIIDYWRKKKVDAFSIDQQNHITRPPLQIPSDEPSVVKQLEISEIREKIEQAIKKLPPSLRELFVWRHINELSYDEIAEIKGLPVGTIKNRVFQAKEMIRSILGEAQ